MAATPAKGNVRFGPRGTDFDTTLPRRRRRHRGSGGPASLGYSLMIPNSVGDRSPDSATQTRAPRCSVSAGGGSLSMTIPPRVRRMAYTRAALVCASSTKSSKLMRTPSITSTPATLRTRKSLTVKVVRVPTTPNLHISTVDPAPARAAPAPLRAISEPSSVVRISDASSLPVTCTEPA